MRGSSNACLLFDRNIDEVIGYVTLDYTGNFDKRRSLIEYMFTIGGCVISWNVTLKNLITFFITEVEYNVITKVCKEVTWLRGLVDEISVNL